MFSLFSLTFIRATLNSIIEFVLEGEGDEILLPQTITEMLNC